MSFSAGEIIGQLKLDLSPYTSALAAAEGRAHSFAGIIGETMSRGMDGLVASATRAGEAIIGTFRSVADSVRSVAFEAERTGVEVEFLSAIGKAAEAAGSGVEGVAHALKLLGKNSAEALSGSMKGASLQAEFQAIGISVSQLKSAVQGGDLENLFLRVADGIGAMGSGAEKTRTAMKLLGGSGTELIPLFNRGTESLTTFAQKLSDLGAGVTPALAHAGEKFGELEAVVGASWEGIKKTLAAPILNYVAEHFDELVEKITGVASQINAALGGVGETIAQMIPKFIEFAGGAITGIIQAFKTLKEILGPVFSLLGSVANLVGAVLGPVFRTLQPILEAVAKALSAIADVVGKVLSAVGGVIHGVTDALGLTSTPQGTAEAAGPMEQPRQLFRDVAVNVSTEAATPEEVADVVAKEVHRKVAHHLKDHMLRHHQGAQSAHRVKRSL